MAAYDPQSGDNRPLREQMRQTAFNALIAAALMLLFGTSAWRGGLQAVDGTPRLYALSVTGYVWTLLIGGLAMLCSAIMLFSGLPFALAADAVLAGIVGVLFLFVGGVQVAYEGAQNITAVLLLIFGVLFLRSAWVSWCMHRDSAGARAAPASGQDERPRPASSDAERQEAMERLLSRKRLEPAVQRTTVEPEPLPPLPAEVVAPPAPAPAPPPEPPPRAVAAADEPAPEGFLADLGREESEGR